MAPGAVKRMAVALAIGLGLAGGVTAAPAVAATAPRPLVLTDANDGSAVPAAVGQTVIVRLPGRPSAPWTEAESSDQSVLSRRGTKTHRGSIKTTFSAVAAGQADLSATQHPRCPDHKPCQFLPRAPWHVTVTVG